MNLAPGVLVASRFELVRLLGRGGMGTVWLARHVGLDVLCAVKFIQSHAADSVEVRARFAREAKAAAQLRSPNVVQILDHGEWEGAPYIAMEYLEGEELAQRLQRQGKLAPQEVADIAAQVGRALVKAHAARLVHRDLKPANIFLVRDDDREIAKVLDFGIAKARNVGADGNTETGAVLGTPYYMSPEQARSSKDVDHRADLWALAVVVFQCITGKLPFVGDGFGDLLIKIVTEPIPVPSQVAPVPPGFDAWWARATARDPTQRFQSAKELTEALSLALGVTMPGPATSEPSALLMSPASSTLDTPVPPDSVRVSTPMQELPAVQVAVPRARSWLPLVIGMAAVAGVALGGAATAFFNDRRAPVPEGASPTASVTTTTAAVPASSSSADAAAPMASASAPAPPPATAAPRRAPGTVRPKPTAGPKPKTDFGI